ncbi:MAG TPA: EamA family transporter [Thermoanaerobaculia bacterium]|nr:EamA family transporter [Thermoanaerobaculia bacterium]
MTRDRALAYAAFAVVCIVWGTTYLAIRIAVRTIPPMLLTSARFVVAGLILFAFALLRREPVPRDRRTLVELLIVGLLMVGIGNFTVVWAEQWVPSGDAALLVATAPFWLVLMERMRKEGERIDARRAIGMIIGFIGVALLVTPGGAGRAFDAHFIAGAVCMQGASIAWQYGTIRSKYNLDDVPPLMSSAFQMLIGGIGIGIAGIAAGEPRRLTFSAEGLGALAYLTLFGSVLAYTSYVYAVRKIRVTTLSVYAYINPLVAVILGWLILREQLTPLSIVAMLTILGGVAIVQTPGRRMAAHVVVDRRGGRG